MKEVLIQLRDIHTPDPIRFMPISAGWLLIYAMAVLVVVLYWWFRVQRSPQRLGGKNSMMTALRELEDIQQQYNRRHDAKVLYRRLSTLIRRYMLARFPRHEVAGLAGEHWLVFLDRFCDGRPFSQGIGKNLISAPYGGKIESGQEQALLSLVKSWIKKVP